MSIIPEHLTEPLEEPQEQISRQVDIEAAPDEVWEALATEEGRDRWLEPDPGREVYVESANAPGESDAHGGMVWWWWHGDEPARRVDLTVIAIPTGTRVVVTETAPRFPLAMLAAAFSFALA